jgi:hypothetical protein
MNFLVIGSGMMGQAIGFDLLNFQILITSH